MPFSPIIPASGLAGWNFLGSSLTSQTEIFNRSPDIQRDIDYFYPDYLNLANTFVVGAEGELRITAESASEIAQKYQTETFEVELGNVDNSMRLSLNFQREMAEIASDNLSENAGWFKAMASVPIRTVLEGAFNLPEGFSQLDLDRQKDILSDKANDIYGGKTVDVFDDPDVIENTVRRFLLRQQVEQGPSASTPGFAAISILNGGLGSAGITNLLLSNS